MSNQLNLFVRNDRVIEEIDLYVEHVVEPIHYLRFVSELADEAMAQAMYEQIAAAAYNDHLLTTSKEIIGPVPPPDPTFCITSADSHEDDKNRVPVPQQRLPSVILRLFDQAPSDAMALTDLDTNITLAVREVATRTLGWNLWNIHKGVATLQSHKLLSDNIAGHTAAQASPGGSGVQSTQGIVIPFVAGVECTTLHFTKRVEVTRVVDITEQVLQQQEEQAFKVKQNQQRLQELQRQRMYSFLCTNIVPAQRRLETIQTWLTGIEDQQVRSTFVDAGRRSVLHWIVEWSEDAYPQNRLGADLLRSHIFFALELGMSPLMMDASSRTPMSIANDDKRPRPRAKKVFREAAMRSRATSRLPLEGIVFESVAGRFVQAHFSATKSTKFFALELVHDATAPDAAAVASFYAIFLYDLALEWKFPIIQFGESVYATSEPSSVRFYVVPFCRESHATTEGDILICSNGTFVSVDYTARHPKVSSFSCPRFGFDVVGGEGISFCCTVQWAEGGAALQDQEQRERSEKLAKERAALRVAKSGYLKNLARELEELELIETKPKTQSELDHDSEELFSEKFAERILLFPYGPQTQESAAANSSPTVAFPGARAGSVQTPRELGDSASFSQLKAALSFGGPMQHSGGRLANALQSRLSTSRGSCLFNEEESMSSSQQITSKSESAPLGVLCVLFNGALLAIPLSRFAMTTHATAPLADRVEKLVEAVKMSLQRHDTDQKRRDTLGDIHSHGCTPRASTVTPSNGQRRITGSSATHVDDAGDCQPSEASFAFGGRNSIKLVVDDAGRTGRLSVRSPRDSWADGALTPTSIVSRHGSMTTLDDASSRVLYPKVIATPLSAFCKDAHRTPIAITSTSQRVLIGLPNTEVVQFTTDTNRFTKVLGDAASSSRTLTLDGNGYTPLAGADTPCSIVACEHFEAAKRTFSAAGEEEDDSVPTTVIWCGKSMAVRTIRDWSQDAKYPLRDILVEDLHMDQEVTCAVLHPRSPHLVIFSRRGQLCIANLKTGSVSTLCPIVISEAEFLMRSAQMDKEAGAASSGVEMLSFNADGTLLMRYCPLYRSATLYEFAELAGIIEKEERSLVKGSNLIAGFAESRQEEAEDGAAALTRKTSSLAASTAYNGHDLRSLKAVPKERLRGYLERLTTNRARSTPQQRVDHAFFVIEALKSCASFHANVGDGDGRNCAAIVSTLEPDDMLKDTLFKYWHALLDDGGNLYQCSEAGRRAIDDVALSTAHIEAIYAYARRQDEEISRREDAQSQDGKNEKVWQSLLTSHWPEVDATHLVSPSRSSQFASRLYALSRRGGVAVAYVNASTAALGEFASLLPAADTSFAVVMLSDAADLLFLPSGTVSLVEHPSVTTGHRPVVTTRRVVTSLAWREHGLLGFMDDVDFRMSHEIVAIASSLCSGKDIHTCVGSVVAELQGECSDSTIMDAPPREATVAHLAVVVRSRQSDAGDAAHDAVCTLLDIPVRFNEQEWQAFQDVFATGSTLDGPAVLAAFCAGFERGRGHVKQQNVLPSPAFSLSCDGPFSAFVCVHQRSESTDAPQVAKLFLCDSSNVFSALPSWCAVRFTARNGQTWSAPLEWAAGNPVGVQPLYDALSDTMWVAVTTSELCIAEIDWSSSPDEHTLPAKVVYFIEAAHQPVGESISCKWVSRDLFADVLHPSRSNCRTIAARSADDVPGDGVRFRDDADEFVLLFLKEGYLCVLDMFVRKAPTVLCTMPLHSKETERMMLDGDIPDPTADAAYSHLAPIKVLSGGMNTLVALTHEGVLVRHNTLFHNIATMSWRAISCMASSTADHVDEYGHLGGGIAARTLVHLPAYLFSSASRSPRASPRMRKDVLPHEMRVSYCEPLKFDHLQPHNLVSSGKAPPRTTRLKGYLSSQDPGVDPTALLQFLQLIVDAIESQCTVPSQRDVRGRTALHILADLFPHLTTEERMRWFDCLLKIKCNLFACDGNGSSVLDRTDIRTFLFTQMGTSYDTSYRQHYEMSTLNELSRAVSDSDGFIDPLGKRLDASASSLEVLQVAWSHVCSGVLYIIDTAGILLRMSASSGRKDVVCHVPRFSSAVVMKLTTIHRPLTAMRQSYGDHVPLDHQLADIILFSHGVLVTVYDPDGTATVQVSESGGLKWNPRVASSFTRGNPVAPSRLRDKQLSATDGDTSGESTGFSELCPSDQHTGCEVVWFVRNGEDVPDGASTLVCLAVTCLQYHTVHVTKLYPPKGVHRIFPRHMSAMVAEAVVTMVPLSVPRPELLDRFEDSGKDINRYELAHLDNTDGNNPSPPEVEELDPQKFTQIVRASHSPYGDVFMIVANARGFADSASSLHVHVFSCPQFIPVATLALHDPLGDDLKFQAELYLQQRGAFFCDHLARHHLWSMLRRQYKSSTLYIADRSVAWCEGGGGMCVAKWNNQPSKTTAATLLTKGDHVMQRLPMGCSEAMSVDSCSPGFHRDDRIHIGVCNGSVYVYGLATGVLQRAGDLPACASPQGDVSVSVSNGNAQLVASSEAPHARSERFVAFHNLSTRSVVVVGYDDVHNASETLNDVGGVAVLHYTPAASADSSRLVAEDHVSTVVESHQKEEGASMSAATQSQLLEDLDAIANGDGRFSDAATLSARMELKFILEEQFAADALRLEEQHRLQEQRRMMLETVSAARKAKLLAALEDCERALPKECTPQYWRSVSAIPTAKGAMSPRLCATLEELLTLERVYTTMMWPVLRGKLSAAAASDRHGRSVLMYLAAFYASYFSIADATPPLLLSLKVKRLIDLRKQRMLEEWLQLLTLGASVYASDRHGHSLANGSFALHASTWRMLADACCAATVQRLRIPATTAAPTLAAPALALWQHEQRSAGPCAGDYVLGYLRSGDVTLTLVLHSRHCCGMSSCTVTLLNDVQEILWEDSASEKRSSVPAVVLLQMPWSQSGAVLVTPRSVVALQISPTLMQQHNKGHRPSAIHDLSRVNPAPAAVTPRSSAVNKFTVPCYWSQNDKDGSESLSCLSHWVEMSADYTTFQFAGASLTRRRCFLKMWQCPLAFLQSETHSSFARYVAEQLTHCIDTEAIHEFQAAPLSASCVATGRDVIFEIDSSLHNVRLHDENDALRRRSLLETPPSSLSHIAALVKLEALHQSACTAPHSLRRGVMRCSRNTIIMDVGTHLRLCRVSDGSDRCVPTALVPTVLTNVRPPPSTESYRLVRFVVLRSNTAAQHNSQSIAAADRRDDGSNSRMLLLFAAGSAAAEPQLIAVELDVSDGDERGSATLLTLHQPIEAITVESYDALQHASIQVVQHDIDASSDRPDAEKYYLVSFTKPGGDKRCTFTLTRPQRSKLDVGFFALLPSDV